MGHQTLDVSIFAELRDLMDDSLSEFIATYLENSPLLISKIEHGLISNNTEEIFMNAHQLKGGSGSLGAMKLAELAKDIEHMSKNGSVDGVQSLLLQLKEEFSLVEEDLKAEL